MTGIINVGIGNVGSLCNMLRRIGCDCKVISSIGDLTGVRRVIFPGVGSFDHGMEQLNLSGLRDEIERLVVSQGMPFLGICLGMQLLGLGSEEGVMSGLGWISADSIRFRQNPAASQVIKIPHMGWNQVNFTGSMSDFMIDDGVPRFYFVHSYHVVPRDPSHAGGVTSHCGDFISCVRKGNIVGCQFHPEKSHRYGMNFLAKFAEIS